MAETTANLIKKFVHPGPALGDIWRRAPRPAQAHEVDPLAVLSGLVPVRVVPWMALADVRIATVCRVLVSCELCRCVLALYEL